MGFDDYFSMYLSFENIGENCRFKRSSMAMSLAINGQIKTTTHSLATSSEFLTTALSPPVFTGPLSRVMYLHAMFGIRRSLSVILPSAARFADNFQLGSPRLHANSHATK